MLPDETLQVLAELGLDPDTSLNEAEGVLKERLVALHPDHVSSTAEAPAEFHRLKQALESVRQNKSKNALVPIDQVRAIAEVVTRVARDLQPVPAVKLPTRQEIATQIRKNVRHEQFGGKLASGTALAVSTVLFAMLGQEAHPILRALTKAPYGTEVLIASWLISAGIFAITWFREWQAEQLAGYLLTDDGLRETVRRMIEDSEDDPPSEAPYITLSFFADAVQFVVHRQKRPLLWRLSKASALEIAAKQVEILEERGALKTLDRPSIERRYQFVEGAVHGLVPR